MLDFETLSTDSNATLIQVGACFFNRKTGTIEDTFKRNIDAVSSVSSGTLIDPATVYWWFSQSSGAIKSVVSEPRYKITDVFNELNDFLEDVDEIWSHATFDFVILQQTMKRLKIKPKYHYRVARDIRTLSSLSGNKKFDGNREGIHHDALDDCLHQVKYVVAALNSIQLIGN